MCSFVKSRRLTFSLRVFLAIAVILCLSLGWYLHRAGSQRSSVSWVENNGGYVSYSRSVAGRWLKNWIAGLIGEDYVRNIESVEIDGQDKGTKKRFDIGPIANFHNLKELVITNAELESLQPLRRLSNLKVLNLDGCRIKDLSPLPQMMVADLSLNNTNVTDLSPLRSLTSLKYLRLKSTPVEDLSPLTELQNLEYLDLMRSRNVKKFDSLTSLSQLKYLCVAYTGISEEDIKSLKASLPSCSIDE